MAIQVDTSNIKYKGITFVQDTEPSNPSEGDTWMDKYDYIHVFNGKSWITWYLAGGAGADYGYVCGGDDGTNILSTIDRFQFPFDSGTATNVGNLTGTKENLPANNSSNYGYVCGGYSGVYFSTIDRFQFPFNSGTATHVGNLSGSREYLSANNSSNYGYVCGAMEGGTLNKLSTIDRFQFPFDSGTATHVGNLSGLKAGVAANNSNNYGYVCGGYSGVYFSTIDRFQFPFDSGTATHVGNLSGSREYLSANNSSNYGYVCGGYDGTNTLSTVDRFQFPFDSGTATHVGNLSGLKAGVAANNSSNYGYVCGGNGPFSTIDRFQFPFDSGTATHVGNLNVSNDEPSATDGVDFVTQFV